MDESLIRCGDYDPEVSLEQARLLLTAPSPPTAVFAANDMSAIATIEVATELGLRVPADLSVVGFDNIPESALCAPPLTTIDQPIRKMGERSIELLLQLIRGEQRRGHPHHARDGPGRAAVNPGPGGPLPA